MASRHFSLDMSELGDVTDLLIGFERQNQVRTQWKFFLEWRDKAPSIVVEATAWGMKEEDSGVKPLGYVSVRCSDLNLKHWSAAITHVLYALDFQCALNELEEKEPKRA